jgi:hypothetical protein
MITSCDNAFIETLRNNAINRTHGSMRLGQVLMLRVVGAHAQCYYHVTL